MLFDCGLLCGWGYGFVLVFFIGNGVVVEISFEVWGYKMSGILGMIGFVLWVFVSVFGGLFCVLDCGVCFWFWWF